MKRKMIYFLFGLLVFSVPSFAADIYDAMTDVPDGSSLASVVSSLGNSQATIIIDRNHTLYSDLTVPENIQLYFISGGKITVGGNISVTLNGDVVNRDNLAIFSGDYDDLQGDFFERNQGIAPDWFSVSSDASKISLAVRKCRTVRFNRDYSVDRLALDFAYKTIDFNGFKLTGIATSSEDYILRLIMRKSVIKRLYVDGGGKTNYTCAVQWLSQAGKTSAFNLLTNCKIANIDAIGLLYGYEKGVETLRMAQSENIIDGFVTTGVSCPIYMNQQLGQLIVTEPNFSVTATNGIAVENDMGHLRFFNGVISKDVDGGVFMDLDSHTSFKSIAMTCRAPILLGSETGYDDKNEAYRKLFCKVHFENVNGSYSGSGDMLEFKTDEDLCFTGVVIREGGNLLAAYPEQMTYY